MEEVRVLDNSILRSINGEFQPSTFNAEARTVDVVFATDYPVKRFSSDGDTFYEQLVISKEAIDMTRLLAGAPVLDNHDTKLVYGVTQNPRIEGNVAVVTLRFSKSKIGEEMMNEVVDGIRRNISVGYRPVAVSRVSADTYALTKWEPTEVSIVSVPADPHAQVRNYIVTPHIVEQNPTIVNTVEMTEEEKLQELQLARELAVKEERTRSLEIKDAVRSANLDSQFAEKLITDGVDINLSRKLIIDEMAKVSATKDIATTKVALGADEKDVTRKLQLDSLMVRAGLSKASEVPKEAMHQFGSDTLLDVAKRSLANAGESIVGLSKLEIVTRAITSHTSDFPVLLEGLNRTVLLKAYTEQADTWRRWTTTGSVSDFREWKRVRMGTLSNLDSVLEGGEFKNKAIGDGESEKIKVATKGNIINVSRQMIVNDDLGAFTRLTQMLGRAAARSIETDAYALLVSNPVMSDGVALFHSTHGNIATTAAVPSVTSIDKMRQQMAIQKDISGNDFLDIRPSIALAPVALGGSLKVLNSSQFDPDAVTNKFQTPNIVAGLFSDVVDSPRLSGTAWYMFANPSEEPVIEVAFLDGKQEPFMESRQGFEVDGLEWKIRLDYGIAAIGWRGAMKNAGV